MIPSPCIDVCKMDEASGLCRGCYRELPEIAAWSTASDAQKLLILAAVARRRGRLDPAANRHRDSADC